MNSFRAIEAHDSQTFDCYRGLSAWVVAICHFHQIIVFPSYPDPAVSKAMGALAAAAVAIFFVVSGFMVGSSMLRHVAQGFDLKQFVRDRLVRLFPPLLFALFLTGGVSFLGTALGWGFGPGDPANWPRPNFAETPRTIFPSLFFVQGFFTATPVPNLNGPLWSLAYEFWFYAMGLSVPLWLLRREKSTAKAGMFLLVLGGFLVVLASPYRLYIGAGFGVWLAGAFLAIGYQRGQLVRFRAAGAIGFLLLLGAWAATLSSPVNALQTASRFLGGIAFAGLLAWQLDRQPKLANRKLAALANSAKYSYTLYAIHFPLLLMVQGAFGTVTYRSPGAIVVTGLIALPLIGLLAWFSARWLENRSWLLKKTL